MFAAIAAVLGTVSAVAMQPAFAYFTIDGSNVNNNNNNDVNGDGRGGDNNNFQ
jgi:hypothetical protein